MKSQGMRSEWERVPVSAIAEPVLGGTPSKNNPDYWEDGEILWATAKDIASTRGRFIYSTEKRISLKGLTNSAAKLLPKGTIVITARGTVGALARLGREMAFNQTCYGLVPDMTRVSEDYLYYALIGTLSHMKTVTYGTVFETITKKSFDSWFIPLPPLPEQRAIAHILGTLDDKIELNRRMNETLEAMAQAIFKSWFVDFDPVVVNALKAGNPIPDKFAQRAAHYRDNPDALGLPHHILRLFPDRFVDSELGPIPEGWKVTNLGSE
ncbi:MAG TPA: restriction endonuclease subunit S, partial [Thermodesulfatator sp.]|nr:restriction endonuclease subunit S [Thermodesulfatator sp.]